MQTGDGIHADDARGPAPWNRHQGPNRFSHIETVTRIGHYKWLEMRLFEVLGTWVAIIDRAVIDGAEIAYRLGHHCSHHAFHAELWHRRLVELGHHRPDDLTVAAAPEIEALFDALLGEMTIVERLVGLYRVVLPRLIAAYGFHLDNINEVSDAPSMKVLDICLRDDLEQWRQGELMAQTLLGPDDIDRVTDRQAELMSLVVAAGGLVGLGSLSVPTDD